MLRNIIFLSTTMLLLLLLLLLMLANTTASAFDISKLIPIAENNIHTGNRILYEREINADNVHSGNGGDNATSHRVSDGFADGAYLDVNEIPVRYDETQLWRIYNISEHMRDVMPVAQLLENKFGGIVWKENSKFLDISIGKENLKAARSYLAENQFTSELLHDNIQNLIDTEELEGIKATQSEPGSRRKKQVATGKMNWKDYQDLDTIYGFMREIRTKFPNICRLYSIGKTAGGRDLKVLRISTNPRQNKKIWIDGGIHAREWISPATVTFVMYQLMSSWDSQPKYIKDKTWYFMPVMNPDGYMYSRTTNRLWRKNRSPNARSDCVGVDLNRNFNIGWTGRGSSTNPCSDTFRGTSAGSELETQAVVTFLSRRKFNLASYLTFHSYGQMIVYPWAYKAVKVRDAAALQRVANTAVQRIEAKTGTVYRASVTYEVLGIAGGGSDDWSRSALGVKYVYTIELRDRGTHGFVLPPAQIKGCGTEGYAIVNTVAQAIP